MKKYQTMGHFGAPIKKFSGNFDHDFPQLGHNRGWGQGQNVRYQGAIMSGMGRYSAKRNINARENVNYGDDGTTSSGDLDTDTADLEAALNALPASSSASTDSSGTSSAVVAPQTNSVGMAVIIVAAAIWAFWKFTQDSPGAAKPTETTAEA